MAERTLAVAVVLPNPDGIGDTVYLPGDTVPAGLAATVSNDAVWAEPEPAPDEPSGRRAGRGGA